MTAGGYTHYLYISDIRDVSAISQPGCQCVSDTPDKIEETVVISKRL